MTQPTNDIEVLRDWIGREQVIADTVDLATMSRLEATLDRSPTLAAGEPLPALWHFASFIETAPMSGLGRDGHPERGGFLPPVALPRRMWAGGRLTFDAPIPVGADAIKTSRIDDVVIKEGSTGTLCFVSVHHTISLGATVCIREEQDIVYREDPAPDAPKPTAKPAPADADVSETITPSAVQLFRYSALTFNGHRIHYDREYATGVEGYDGLVVHGPLTATLLADLAVRTGGTLATFGFRGMSPLLDTGSFTINAARTDDGLDLWAANADGGLAMKATATFA